MARTQSDPQVILFVISVVSLTETYKEESVLQRITRAQARTNNIEMIKMVYCFPITCHLNINFHQKKQALDKNENERPVKQRRKNNSKILLFIVVYY